MTVQISATTATWLRLTGALLAVCAAVGSIVVVVRLLQSALA